MTDDDANAGIG